MNDEQRLYELTISKKRCPGNGTLLEDAYLPRTLTNSRYKELLKMRFYG